MSRNHGSKEKQERSRNSGKRRLSNKEKDREKRLEMAAMLMGSWFSDREIVPRLMDQFGVSQTTAYQDIQDARERSMPGERDRKRLQEAAGQSLIHAYRAAMSKRAPCQSCGAPVPNPHVGRAVQITSKLIELYRLQSSPEELLQDEDLRRQTLEALARELPRFTSEEIRTIMSECEGVLQGRDSQEHLLLPATNAMAPALDGRV